MSTRSFPRPLIIPVFALCLLVPSLARGQAVIKVNENVSVRFGTLVHAWADAAEDSTGHTANNLFLLLLISGGRMSQPPKPPKIFDHFSERYPKIRQAWDLLGEAGLEGPLDERTCRLIKLGIAIGAMREGAVHSAVRKALAVGVSRQEVEQVVALASSVIGLPSAVAVYTWIRSSDAVGRA
jgi:alkylhydroperoxidase/carboxymuconolactone decarboxylase family protein YurZ